MFGKRYSLMLMTILSLSLSARAADWPVFGGPTRDGVAPDTGLNMDWTAHPPKTLWTATLSDNGHAAPTIADGKVYIVDHAGSQDNVRAIDLATGTDVWTFSYPDAAKFRNGFTHGAPAIADGRVYTFSKLGKVHCLDAKTGKLIWTRDGVAEFAGRRPEWDFAASPVVADGKLFLIPGGIGAAVVALDAATGKTLWQEGNSKAAYASPVLATINGKSQLVAFIGEGLVGLDADTGKRLWSFAWPINYDQNSASPIVRGNTVFISTAWKKGSVLLDVTDNQPKVIWQTKDMQARFSTPVFYQGRIYGSQDSGKIVCLDAQTGALLWMQPGYEFASTIAVDGRVIYLEGKTGDLVLLDAKTAEFKQLARIRPLPGPECWTAPILSDGRLIVRNKKSLACVDLRAER